MGREAYGSLTHNEAPFDHTSFGPIKRLEGVRVSQRPNAAPPEIKNMVMPITEHQRVKAALDAAPRPIVAFDFDGTLTIKDSYLAFLRWRAGSIGYALGVVRLIPRLLAYLFDSDRGRLKAAATRVFLSGTLQADLERDAQRFADMSAAKLLRPDALATWRGHVEAGDLVVIVTASPEDVVAPFARQLGAELLIGTRLELDPKNRITGRFVGENCRAEEKVARLRAAFGEGVAVAAAYGDTSGDEAMLAFAAQGHMRVFAAKP
ncbi:MAG: HAD-IB family hydrolase [Caulobacteraceae bacterium]